jgi:hypothetical protein
MVEKLVERDIVADILVVLEVLQEGIVLLLWSLALLLLGNS